MRNQAIKSMYCISCGLEFSVGDYPLGCPSCLKKGHPSSLSFKYKNVYFPKMLEKRMKKYTNMLPYINFPTLGEGDTPLIEVPQLERSIGVRKLYIKNEFQNPTGSHKDRMNPFIIARAKETGQGMVAAASSGNEGISLACYAAAGNIPCTVVTTKSVKKTYKSAILSTGAKLIQVSESIERWKLIREKMISEGWFSATNVNLPPVGSCSFGVQGYKTISYEIYEDLKDEFPDYIMIPTSRGDLLWGIYEGFADLITAGIINKMPRLIAVEPFERLENTKEIEECFEIYDGNSVKTPSIAGNTVTVQSFLALRKSNGFAVSVPQNLVERAVCEMAGAGLYLETSSALAVSCLKKARKEQRIPAEANVIIIATSHGFKND